MNRLKLLLILFIALLTSNCSSDDETISPNSKFTINETEYSTPNGYLISLTNISDPLSPTQALYNTVYLLNGEILNDEFHGGGCDYSNNLTQGIIFSIFSPYDADIFLPAGTYNFGISNDEPYLSSISIVINNNCIISSNDIKQDQIINGSIEVEVDEKIHSLIYQFETVDFGTISGKYVGELKGVRRL